MCDYFTDLEAFSTIDKSMVRLANSIKYVAAVLILSDILIVQAPAKNSKSKTNDTEEISEKPKKFNFAEVVKMNKKYSTMSDKCPLRIYGGIQASRGEIPYQVALRKERRNGRLWALFCGGSIITEKHVLTAAHCMDRNKLRTFRVIAGTDRSYVYLRGFSRKARLRHLLEIQKTETWRRPLRGYCHRRYSKRRLTNDISVLEIERPFYFSAFVQPILMLSKYIDASARRQCLVSGYGLMEGREVSPNLRMVCVPTIPIRVCRRSYGRLSGLTQICAGVRGKDSCQGDSGGPMVCDGTLVGIVSFGGKCAESTGVYTLVSGYTNSKHVRFRGCDSYVFKVNNELIIITSIFIQIV